MDGMCVLTSIQLLFLVSVEIGIPIENPYLNAAPALAAHPAVTSEAKASAYILVGCWTR